jgi:hypothetical protein
LLPPSTKKKMTKLFLFFFKINLTERIGVLTVSRSASECARRVDPSALALVFHHTDTHL